MRKSYPYLQDPYTSNLNVESAKRRFLSYIDDFVNQRQYVQITLLDWEENPIKAIEGEISSGSISKDGASSVRRTCSLTCAVDGEAYNVDDMNMDFALNRKVFIEIGIKNDSPYYREEYPILWFPQGIFFITSFSMNSSTTTAVNLSLGLKDKMAMLNGDVGGNFISTVRFDEFETQISEGEFKIQKTLVYETIIELLNHYGGEDLNNIVVEDVPLRIRKIMKWTGNTPLYGVISSTESEIAAGEKQWTFSLQEPDSSTNYYTFDYGADVGYIYSDFVFNKELYGSPGQSICNVLDEIKNMLGNYEYFYDEMGIFHFREIKNFLNVTQGEFVLDNMNENDYLIETTNEKTSYAFVDNKNITSITVTPQYNNIKNEYVVHGLQKGGAEDVDSPIMYHLVIDEKPQIQPNLYNGKKYYGVFNNIACYTDPLDGLTKLTKWMEIENQLPAVGNFNLFYKLKNDTDLYYWDNTVYKKAVYIDKEGKEQSPFIYDRYYALDWRTYLYLQGLEAQVNGTDEGVYFAELAAFWPGEYDLRHDKQSFFNTRSGNKESYFTLTEGRYFLDFIDSSSAELGKFSVSAIGRRTVAVSEDEINCLFEPEINNIIFLNIDNPEDNASENTMLNDDQMGDAEKLAKQRNECVANGHPFTQVHEDIYSQLSIGGYKNAAYERIRYELFCHSSYQKSISLTSIPVFYLEPNTRVSINDRTTNTYGDYMVKNINITFGPGANMSVALNEIRERL